MTSSKPCVGLGRSSGLIARRLAHDILSGKYAPGHVLPTEIDASANFQISRSGYREAISLLTAKGLIESRQKIGTRICGRDRWNLLDPELQGWMLAAKPSSTHIKALFEMRLIIEPAAAEFSAIRRSKEDINVLGQALDIMRSHTLGTELGREADAAFHRRIMQSANNEALRVLSASVEAAVNWTIRLKTLQQIYMDDYVPRHEIVLEAIKRGDGGAARWCMEALIRTAVEDTRRALDEF